MFSTKDCIMKHKQSTTNTGAKSKNKTLAEPHLTGGCLAVLFLAVIMLLPALAAAATYYVDPAAGNDNADGSAANPWRTIGKAKTSVSPGDIVNLLPGDYGSVTFGQSGDSYGSGWSAPVTYRNNPASPPHSAKFSHVLFSGSRNFYIIVSGLDVTNTGSSDSCIKVEGGAQVRITDCKAHGNSGGAGPSYANIFTKNANNVLIEDCEVYYGGDWAFAVQLEGSDSVTVRACHVHDIVGSGIRTGGGQNYIIENNIIHDQRAEWNSDVHGSGISIHSHNTTISGNIVYNFGNTRPIRFYQSYAGPNGYRNMLVENNLVYKTSDFRGTQWWVEFIDVGPNCVFRNNTFVDSTVMVFAQNADGSGLSIHNNVFTGGLELNNYGASASGPGRTKWDRVSEGNNIYGRLIAKGCGYQCSYDSFSSTSNSIVGTSFAIGTFFATGAAHYPYDGTYPYQLSGNSLAVDFGNAAYAPAVDLLGAARVGAPDAGCYEYGSNPTPRNQPPNANAGPDQTVTASAGSAQVLLDGSASTDSDGNIVTYVWVEGTNQIATGPNPTVALSEGLHTITLTVTDDDDATDADSVTITVETEDLTAPAIVSIIPSLNSLEILFDEPLDSASAQNLANYQIDNGITITAASLNTDTVTLTTSDHTEQIVYTLTVTNIADSAGNKMSPTLRTYTYSSGLVGFWCFEEGSGQTTQDYSGNENTATLINSPTWTQSGEISFDGIDDYLNCGNDASLNLTGSLTITACINPATFGQNGWGRVVDKGSASTGYSFFLDQTDSSLAYVVYGGLLIKSDPGVIELNKWQHIAAVYNSSAQTVTFYVDSRPAGTVSYTTPPLDSAANPLVIGLRGYDLNRAFSGLIDNVRVYNRPLTENQILEVFNTDFPFLLEPIGDKQVNENSNLNFTVNTRIPDLEVFLQDHNLPTDPTFINNTFDWTPTYDHAGVYDAVFTAQYGILEDFETVTITVNNLNRPPVLDSIADKSVDENSTLAFSVNAVDPDGDTVTYSVDNLPAGASFTNPTFEWTPTDGQAGLYDVTFIANDGNDQDSQTVRITVNDIPINANEFIIDNTDTATSHTGNWYISGGANPYGANSLWSRDGTTFTWTFTPTVSGYYDLSMWWTAWPSRAASIPVDIRHAAGSVRVYINQQENASRWNTLGNFGFLAGRTYYITITSQPDPASTCADAVKFTLTSTSPPPIIIDNGDPQTSCTGKWHISGGADPYGSESLWARDGATYTWTFTPVVSGHYDLSMYWTPWKSRSSNVPVKINHADGLTTVYVNQRQNGSQFNTLGEFLFNAGRSYNVTIVSQPAPASTCADAVQFIFAGH